MVLPWLFIRNSVRWKRAREREKEKGTNSSNKWINGYLTDTHAGLVKVRPWASYKKGSCKSGGKKKNLYQRRAYAWLSPLKDCLIKWLSGWVLGPPSEPCCHWHAALCGLSAPGVDRIWYKVTRNDGLTFDDASVPSTHHSACQWHF